MSVAHARELAARMNAQLAAGVEEAEARKVRADLAVANVIRTRNAKKSSGSSAQSPNSLFDGLINTQQSLNRITTAGKGLNASKAQELASKLNVDLTSDILNLRSN